MQVPMIVTVCSCAVLIGFGAGSFLGLTVFSKAMGEDPEYSDFTNPLSLGLGLQYFVTAVGMLIAAQVIRLENVRIRDTVAVTAIGMFFVQLLVALALYLKQPYMFVLLLAIQGIPSGISVRVYFLLRTVSISIRMST